MSVDLIRELNRNLKIKTTEDLELTQYGRVLSGFDFTELIKYAEENTEIPSEGNSYTASVAEIENFEVISKIRNRIYGTLEIEAGPCTGQNTSLTGVEYHQGSEVTIAVTDCILIIGKLQDMVDNIYDSNKAEIFYLKKGQAVELYGTTLHYTPCKVNDDGFMTIVVLLKETNASIEKTDNVILTKKNKYFITHESQIEKVKSGVYPGLVGELIEIKLK
ncbi:DUF4867 family protein [Clostridium saccharoperbutylacetonicum]|uniref:DUF4867 family protein n=1 Tax=Clostridium saccharoperbutylacetonicum TaxID=36745 RepID=UPI0039ED8D0F